MPRTKMIKEVEFSFSPRFIDRINEVKKKSPKKKVKVVKAKADTAKPPRGYKITQVVRELNGEGLNGEYELYELTGKKLAEPKRFVSYEHALNFIGIIEQNVIKHKALIGKTYGGMLGRGIMAETKDLKAGTELPELNTELPERCDKTSVEDTDA
jgi:hypothetical protein